MQTRGRARADPGAGLCRRRRARRCGPLSPRTGQPRWLPQVPRQPRPRPRPPETPAASHFLCEIPLRRNATADPGCGEATNPDVVLSPRGPIPSLRASTATVKSPLQWKDGSAAVRPAAQLPATRGHWPRPLRDGDAGPGLQGPCSSDHQDGTGPLLTFSKVKP